MRKFWIALLSIALIMVFTMPVAALDVKFSGSYYVQGVYEKNRSLKDDAAGDGSTAFIGQRLRMSTEFKVAEGLSLVTRFDALEKKWGDQTWALSSQYDSVNRLSSGNSGARVQENIEFERAYVDFNTAIGKFMVGYQNFVAFGTTFIDTHVARPGIKWMLPVGNTTFVVAMEQVREGTSTPFAGASSTNQGVVTDGDNTAYDFAVVQKFQGGDAGVLVQYLVGKATKPGTPPAGGYKTEVYLIDPYVKATFGPVFVEAEFYYAGGWMRRYEGSTQDIKAESYGAYVHAKGDFGPAYAGAKFMYMKGDDPGTTDKVEGSLAAAFVLGQIASPCLLLWNDETVTWMGTHTGYAVGTPAGNFPDNLWLVGAYGGFKPMPKLDVQLGVYWARADKQPTYTNDKNYGTEVDLIAKYKIYDNLEYMIGAAYLFTGDYFKGTLANNPTGKDVKDDYLITHKLTLSF